MFIRQFSPLRPRYAEAIRTLSTYLYVGHSVDGRILLAIFRYVLHRLSLGGTLSGHPAVDDALLSVASHGVRVVFQPPLLLLLPPFPGSQRIAEAAAKKYERLHIGQKQVIYCSR